MAFGRIIDIDEKKMKQQKELDSMRELVRRHDEINSALKKERILTQMKQELCCFPSIR
jgi:hypothetical protein